MKNDTEINKTPSQSKFLPVNPGDTGTKIGPVSLSSNIDAVTS